MFGNSWRVGRIAGVEIRVDASWTVIVALVTYSLFLRFDLIYEDLETGAAIALAAGAAILFFASVLIHEMAHALVALSRGIPVKSITLFLFGGATHAKVEARGPGAEFLIAAVGPLTSLALAGVFGAIGIFGNEMLPEAVAGGFGYLGWVNLLLAGFNLVPGFPLDGGRVLRSIVWRATGNINKATRVASTAGQGVGYLLVAGGLLLVFTEFLATGIWFAAIGWFLAQAARASYMQLQVQRMLEDVEAEEVMASSVTSIPPDINLREAVDDYFMRHDHSAFPVGEDGDTMGLLTLRSVKQVPREDWEQRTVRETMGKLDEQVTVSPGASMDGVLGKLESGEARRVVVVDDGQIVGIITPSDVSRWLRRRQSIEG